MRIEVFHDDPKSIFSFLQDCIPVMGTRPYQVIVKPINRYNRPYDHFGYIEHLKSPAPDERTVNECGGEK